MKDNDAVYLHFEEAGSNDCVRTLPQKRKRSGDDEAYATNSSFSSSVSSSMDKYFKEASAKIDAATTQYLLELKEKRAQAALEHSSSLAQIVQQSNRTPEGSFETSATVGGKCTRTT